jgi:hypothetical protein
MPKKELTTIGACVCHFSRIQTPQPIMKAERAWEHGIAVLKYPGVYQNVYVIVDMEGKIVPEDELYSYRLEVENGCFVYTDGI